MTARIFSSPLRLPPSVKEEAERAAREEGTSLNRFVATAVAEKLATLRNASILRERKGRVDWTQFDRLMRRSGGELPRPGDELPD